MTAPVVDNVLELIGETPLVHLRALSPPDGAAIWAKCEHLNPGGSVKDRICLAMIEAAERDGTIKPGDTIVEPTSGNTGIGLALVCANKGYKLVLTMPASMSLERRALLQAYGAKIVLTPPEQAMDGALRGAREIVEEQGAVMLEQFSNEANPLVHETTTGPELLDAFGDTTIDAFVAAVGTGGTISGVGKVLKAAHPGTHVVAVEPSASPVLAGGCPGPSKIQGLNAGFIPDNYHGQYVDEIIGVDDATAWQTKQALATEEGLLVGISAGANVWAAQQVARQLGAGKTVVTVLCDTGERYFSLAEYFT